MVVCVWALLQEPSQYGLRGFNHPSVTSTHGTNESNRLRIRSPQDFPSEPMVTSSFQLVLPLGYGVFSAFHGVVGFSPSSVGFAPPSLAWNSPDDLCSVRAKILPEAGDASPTRCSPLLLPYDY